MATLPPINAGALKITFPANFPRNEKDLICMLLAGRLKDLFNGRLVCAQLALDDLIKDVTGVSALGVLRDSLIKMKSAINGLNLPVVKSFKPLAAAFKRNIDLGSNTTSGLLAGFFMCQRSKWK